MPSSSLNIRTLLESILRHIRVIRTRLQKHVLKTPLEGKYLQPS